MESKLTTKPCLSLSAVPSGEWVQIQEMQGRHHFLSRMTSLGFTPGARLRVIQNFGRGPLIVTLRDTRVALGRGEATKILVRQISGGDHGH